ncbi:MAG: hypothetical protein OEM93_21080 [Rhodospirillales bacterium]|nr:hypothetical protein [Rhodospirillales bacterium]
MSAARRARMLAREKRLRLREAAAREPLDWQGAEREETTRNDCRGGVGWPYRPCDTLAALERARNGRPTAAEFRAGRRFQDWWEGAGLDQPPALDMAAVRVDGGGRGFRMPDLPRGTRARARLGQAMAALGGVGSAACTAACLVLGEQRTLAHLAVELGYGQGREGQSMAKGTLLAALGILAIHCGFVRSAHGVCTRAGKKT